MRNNKIFAIKREAPFSMEEMIMLSALIVFMVSAVINSGFIHPDEHFQILEFARWKMGIATPQAMAWEHVAKIRPTLQPVFAMIMIRLFLWFGLENPFHQAIAIRMITGLIMLNSLWWFTKAAGRYVNPHHRNGLMAATLFFWMVPMISVHFSSETMSTACLLLLLDCLLRMEKPSVRGAIWMGVVAALGFEFRYQLAFAFVGILAWILAVGRYRWRIWCMAVMGFLGVTALCTVLDCWFYGRFVFAPYNYYYMNIVRHVAALFGESPWYTYILLLAMSPGGALGVPILISICAGTFRHYRNPVVWTFWAFLFFHSIISHKELRFLFPLMPMLPLFMVWAYEMIRPMQYRLVGVTLIGMLVFINVGGLVHVAFKPADNGKAVMMQYLCARASEQEKNPRVKAHRGSNPFRTGPLIAQFYMWQPVDINEDSWDSTEDEKDYDIMVLRQVDWTDRELLLAKGYREVCRSIPLWQNTLNRFYHTYNPDRVLIAYEKR